MTQAQARETPHVSLVGVEGASDSDVRSEPKRAGAPRLLLLRDRDDDIGASIAAGSAAAGWDVFSWPRWKVGQLPHSTLSSWNTVLGYGPHNGSMLPAAELLRLAATPSRPRFVWWLCENAPDPTLSHPALLAGSIARWWGDRLLAYRDGEFHPSKVRAPFVRGQRHRILAELRYFRRHGLLDRLVVTSEARSRVLQQLGFDTVTIPLGYHDGAGRDLQLTRDIDVLFLGRSTPRRTDILRAVTDELRPRGVRVEVFADERWVEGEERCQLLNRAKILINVLRSPGDFTSHRLILGMANKCLVVSEPFLDAAPFRADEHFVEAAPADMSRIVRQLLQDDGLRRAIVERAHQFITHELAMPRLCARCLS